MGYIAALLSKVDGDVSSTLLRMLEAASEVRGDAYGVASKEGAAIGHSPSDLGDSVSSLTLGYRLDKIMPNDPPQPLCQHGYAFAFEGRTWHGGGSPDITIVADVIGAEPEKGIRRLIELAQGPFAVAAIHRHRILCGRDPVGVVPLYIGENSTLAGVASNRKMLWAAGLDAQTLPTGHIAEMTNLGMSLKPVRGFRQPPSKAMAMREAVEELDVLMAEAVEGRCKGVFNASLGFSGGIDSALVAHYLDRAGVNVRLVCVGVEGSGDFAAAERAADEMGLPLSLESSTADDVERDLDSVLWSIEEPDPMKVGVAIPLLWTVRSAADSGSRIFFSGNGSDELFGGYHRHQREYIESGEAVRRSLFRDVASSHEVNYERDYKVCADSGVELRLPFADLKVIEFGLSLPLELKLSRDPGSPRKLILRALAEELGLPEEVVDRRKRAVQYSTGVHKVLRGLAKREGRTLPRYLAERFERVKADRLGELM
jgi:asparagine synthase (glutamine-hydrolysing)